MDKKTYSISMRLRRTTVEYAFVSIPVDGDVLEVHPDDPKKTRVSAEKLSEIAKHMGTEDGVLWARETEPLIELHPLQVPPPRA